MTRSYFDKPIRTSRDALDYGFTKLTPAPGTRADVAWLYVVLPLFAVACVFFVVAIGA